jgi:predicted RNA-binding Zn ribbon-like protein
MVAMSSRHETTGAAPGEHGRPALALVNSRRNGPSGPIDELASTAALCRWLEDHQVVSLRECDGADLRSMIALRDAVRELLLARIEGRTPDPSSLHAVNQATAAAPTARHLDWASADGPSERRDCLGAGGIALARALLAADAIDLVVGTDHADLRACDAPGCLRLMVKDHPRRRWCSTRCGDRVRASRYYHRHRSTSGEDAE